ncbi:unnamed protein product [Ectocarpus fasciculatus]
MKNNAAVDVAKAQAAGGGGEGDQGTRYSEKWTTWPNSASSPRRAAALARRGERLKVLQALQTARACVVVWSIFFHFGRQSFKMTVVPNSSNIVRSCC